MMTQAYKRIVFYHKARGTGLSLIMLEQVAHNVFKAIAASRTVAKDFIKPVCNHGCILFEN